jgi:hypothetical protein
MLRLERLEERTLLSAPPLLVTNLNDSGDGSLRAAVQAANATSGAVIDFARGLHGTITLTSGELDLTSSMTINGPGADKIAVSGNNSSRIFNVSGSSTDVTISGLTLTDGKAADQGGGILNHDSTLNLSGDVLSDNVVIDRPTATALNATERPMPPTAADQSFSPVAVSHRFIRPSLPTAARRRPSGSKATLNRKV